MTDKVWFRLRHTHNTAPDVRTLGTAQETGPVTLGHFIPDLNHLDQAINREEIIPFPHTMRIYPSKTVEFKWNDSQSTQANISASAGAPVDPSAMVAINASASIAFQRSVDNFAAFESLDCFIVNPVDSYIEQSLAQGPVADYVESAKSPWGTWKLFVITGIMIARGAKTSSNEEEHEDGNLRATLSVPHHAGGGSDSSAAHNSGQNLSGISTTDFVWAIRLARVERTVNDVILRKDWSMETESNGATFASHDNNKINVSDVVVREGMTEVSQIIVDEQMKFAFVL